MTKERFMTWEEKLEALQALAETSLRMRSPGDWYVSTHTEILEGHILRGAYGNGATPQEAVEDHWRIYTTEADPSKPIVTNANTDRRKHWFWKGYRWAELQT